MFVHTHSQYSFVPRSYLALPYITLPGFKSLLGWDFFLYSCHLSNCEDSDSLLYQAWPALQVPSGIVTTEQNIMQESFVKENFCNMSIVTVFTRKLL